MQPPPNRQAPPPETIDSLKQRLKRPKKAVVTAGMPYANGPLHLGHLAGAHVPPDIYARWLRMMIGAENVLFVCGTDDHGSTSELSALQAGKPVRAFIDEIHAKQLQTMKRYGISFNTYSGTSRPECFEIHKTLSQEFLVKLHRNGLLTTKTSDQWFDPKLGRFLQDRFVRGKCPNPKCENTQAYSNECDVCGSHFDTHELKEPKSALSDATPLLKPTAHAWLDMWKVSDVLSTWLRTKEGKWRTPVYNEVIHTVLPSIRFSQDHEEVYKGLKAELPPHKSKYSAGRKIQLQFERLADLAAAEQRLASEKIETAKVDAWAHRSISRDVSWGIPIPTEIDPALAGKTLYVWPDSLIAPIAFSKVALQQAGRDPMESDLFWKDPEARIYQFLGQDNVYFYVLMQGALWIGSQKDPMRMPVSGEYQLTDVFGCFHLLVGGEKMSKSRGNVFTADELLDSKGYDPDQLRYYLSLLTLPEKASNFDFAALEERNKFLAGPLNASFEKPISACHSKFGGKVPAGKLNDKVLVETTRIVARYFKSMEKAEYSTLLFALENYARQINSLFTQFKPHDDRADATERADALYSCFYVLKNLMIMLHPFVPATMERLRQSLKLPEDVFRIDELGVPIPAGHAIGEKGTYFPAVGGTSP